jgi:AcrR family transcriptional regulator
VKSSKNRRPVPKPKRTQEERRHDTQQKILAAAVVALVEIGYARLTADEVASRAGVSRGAQNHYFRGKNTLVLAAMKYELDNTLRAARAKAGVVPVGINPIRAFVEDMRDFYLKDSFQAFIELMVVSRTNREVARVFLPMADRYRRTINEIWLDQFERSGLPSKMAKRVVNFTLYVMRGMALMQVNPLAVEETHTALAEWKDLTEELFRLTT